MKTSTQIIAALTTAIALGTGGLAFAHQGEGGTGMHHPASAADVSLHLATVKSELRITSAQEPAWQQFESLVRQQAQARDARRSAMQARRQDPNAAAGTDLAAQRESMRKQRDSDHAARTAARQALYAVLTPEQKALADQRLRAGRGHRMGMHKHSN